MQARLDVTDLPPAPIDAASAFAAHHLPRARQLIETADASALAIILPPADPSHTDWRRALARDLARAYAPKRANVIAAASASALDAMLQFLSDAPGVTGHYCEAHE